MAELGRAAQGQRSEAVKEYQKYYIMTSCFAILHSTSKQWMQLKQYAKSVEQIIGDMPIVCQTAWMYGHTEMFYLNRMEDRMWSLERHGRG